jgi:hypothetical protein
MGFLDKLFGSKPTRVVQTLSTLSEERFGNLAWQRSQSGGEYSSKGSSEVCAQGIAKSASGNAFPVAVELWEDFPLGPGKWRYVINIYCPVTPEAREWIGSQVPSLLRKHKLAPLDFQAINFRNYAAVAEHLQGRMNLKKGEAGSTSVGAWYVNL